MPGGCASPPWVRVHGRRVGGSMATMGHFWGNWSRDAGGFHSHGGTPIIWLFFFNGKFHENRWWLEGTPISTTRCSIWFHDAGILVRDLLDHCWAHPRSLAFSKSTGDMPREHAGGRFLDPIWVAQEPMEPENGLFLVVHHQKMGLNEQGLVNVPFWGFWISPLNICWRLYPQ